MHTEFLFLTESDMDAAGVSDIGRSVDVADEVFQLLHVGDYLMGGATKNNHGIGLVFPNNSPFPNMPIAGPDRRFVSMPAYLGGRFNICGNKWYGSNAQNVKRNLPRSVLTVMLNDKETGEPTALMSANALSAVRTGAVPGVGVRYLPAHSNPQLLSVIGCGVINQAAVRAILSQAPSVTEVVCHNRSRAKAEAFAQWIRDDYGLRASVAESVQECVRNAEIVTVAASRTAPLEVKAEWFEPEATILLSGPMQADEAFWTESRIVYDHIPLHHEYVEDAKRSGDLHAGYDAVIGGPLYKLIDAGKLPELDDSEDLGQIMAEKRPPVQGKRTVFIACGMAVFDVAWAHDTVQNARERGIGQVLELWGHTSAPSIQQQSA